MSLSKFNFKREYRSLEDDLYAEFYSPCLNRSISYDRAVGFFKSTLVSYASSDLARFALDGGKFRLICSPELSVEDLEAMEKGYRDRISIIQDSIVQQLKSFIHEERFSSNVEMIASLISFQCLDVRIAFMATQRGLFHDKMGIFVDKNGNSLSFKGSINDSLSAWMDPLKGGNGESFDVFCSWREGDHVRALSHADYFERLWKDDYEGVRVIPLPKVAKDLLLEKSVSLEEIVSRVEKQPILPPRKRPVIKLRSHQNDVLENWRLNGKRGIVKHATGSGKTITAIIAIKESIDSGGSVIVIVPSSLLFKQWKSELRKFLGSGVSFLEVSSKFPKWKKPGWIGVATTADPDNPMVVLASLRSAASDLFVSNVMSSDRLLIVVDEVHRVGANEAKSILNINAGLRLGLSATPERYGDQAGTDAIFKYFERVLDPVYGLADAIADGHLVPYDYHPHVVSLTPEEDEKYGEITRRITQLWDSSRNEPRSGKEILFQRLLIERSRLIKKASQKLSAATSVLESARPGEKWLVYCEDGTHLEDLRSNLAHIKVPIHEYRMNMEGDPDTSLEWFKEEGGVLLSIRCLDEGVDIPSISHALVIASSQNPRQFIQRRGRVLRRDPQDPTKRKAFVHDILVLPAQQLYKDTPVNYSISELSRALEFASGATNLSCLSVLEDEAMRLGLDLREVTDQAYQFEEESNE